MTWRRVELALALSASPVSLDRILEWGLARPVEVWAAVDEAKKNKWIAEGADAGRGHFLFADPHRRAEVLRTATREDYRDIVERTELAGDLLAMARRLRAEHCFAPAGEIYRALLGALAPERYPGGEPTFLATLLESIRTFRQMYGISQETLDLAVAIAEARGDIASLAVILAARGLKAVQEGREADSREEYRRACDVAQAADALCRGEVSTYVAVGLTAQGRLREGVAAFEELMGDVPDDVIAGGEAWLTIDSATASAPLGRLVIAYANIGHHARALELTHRFLALAERMDRPGLVGEANLFMALVHAPNGSSGAAPYAEHAWRFFSEHQEEPVYVWFAAVMLAWVRGVQGRFADMRAVLTEGLAAREKAGNPPLSGTSLYDLDARYGPVIFEGVTGFDLVKEAERAVRWPHVFGAGIAHRFLARHLGRGPATPDRDEQITVHLDNAVALLREAGALPELSRALADLAAHCERLGQQDRAASLREEERRVRAQVPHEITSADTGREAHLARAVIALGRLAGLRERQEGFWGEIASRLSQGLGAERVALIELGPLPRLLAVRGGDDAWKRHVLELSKAQGSAPWRVETTHDARRVVVTFTAEGLDRRGLAVIENEHAPSVVSPSDTTLLEALGVQLGVLFGNVVLWQELVAARQRLESETRYFRENRPMDRSGPIVAHSSAMTAVLDMVARVASSSTAVLILGETGVGKELIAREVHRQSQRSSGPFIAVHIASMAPGLVASGLFGHERGAFTGATEQVKGRFELADRGTIFLDEVGELSGEDQVRLLRVLQEGCFEREGGSRAITSDFRLIAATNRELEAEVKAGRFREDLYFRLNVFPIRVPPLRERRDEIPTLTLMFMEQYARDLGRTFDGISDADMQRLTSYPWPGNVRELEHLIQRAVLLSDGPRLRIPHLETSPDAPAHATPQERDEWVSLEETERRYIARVLQHTGGRITGEGGAAAILELNPSTLNWRIEKLGLRDLLTRARAGATRKRRAARQA